MPISAIRSLLQPSYLIEISFIIRSAFPGNSRYNPTSILAFYSLFFHHFYLQLALNCISFLNIFHEATDPWRKSSPLHGLASVDNRRIPYHSSVLQHHEPYWL